MTSPSKKRTLSDLLDDVLALPVDQRIAWVEQLGGEHGELKERLRAMVARSLEPEQSALLVTLPKLEQARESEVSSFKAIPHVAGETIGEYRLVRPLGAGAMASVWLARSEDGTREVAIKLAHVAPTRADLLARLAREQELLAQLQHPNIARLYGGGMTAAGQPYLVLEYVAGQSLDAYCRARPVVLRERLGLFLQVALAVAHAHERRIVHRDLKPANVLVGVDGTVRLLDFGIGKLLAEGLPGALVLQLSAIAGQPFTPAYASPEQLLNGTVEFASDVYSLGVILYELLVGSRPHVARDGSPLSLRRAIIDEAVAPPSAHPGAGPLAPQLRGPIDAIVLKALQKRPADRHASARDFAHAIWAVLED